MAEEETGERGVWCSEGYLTFYDGVRSEKFTALKVPQVVPARPCK